MSIDSPAATSPELNPAATPAGGPVPAGAVPPVAGSIPGGAAPEGVGETNDDIDEYEPLSPELVEEEAIRGDFVLRWAVVLLALLLGSTRIGETATLVHVKTGQYLASHGWLPPANDVFSYTAADRHWTNLSWGFDLLTSAVHAIGSFQGLSIFKALVAGLIFGLLVVISRPGLPTWWGSICAALALLACHKQLTAQPGLMTLLGTTIVMWILHRWQQPASKKSGLWMLVPVFIVWCNLDPRAYLGLTLVALYVVGDSLGSWLQFPTSQSASDRRQLWIVTAASVAAMLVHPFLHKSLLAALQIYGAEYPALREYLGGVYAGVEVVPNGPNLIYFPMTAEKFWSWAGVDLATACGLVLLAIGAIMFALNRARLELGQLFVYLGCLALAVACVYELPWAALVCAVLATLNGQSWYQASIRQSYSIDTKELVFSRGGRALTVLAFAAIAFFGGTGRLRDTRAPRTGLGLDANLAVTLDDLTRQLAGEASFDHRPFHTLLSQGDMLIWVGEQSFVDNRVAVYYAPEQTDNLLAIHAQTRDALRQMRDRKSGVGLRKEAPWKSVLDEYSITHLVHRLNIDSLRGGDYMALIELLQDEKNWQMTSLGASAAVVYRRDLKEPALDEYLSEHQLELSQRAYRIESKDLFDSRNWVRPPSFYQRYFWSSKREVPPQIQEALHLVRLAALQGLPRVYETSGAAMALVAIRLAQTGLVIDSNSAEGYVALGQAYQLLAEWDAAVARNGSRSPYSGTRYFQAVAAFNQALVADPHNQTAHFALMLLYQGAGRLDLTLRHMEAIETEMLKRTDEGDDEVDLSRMSNQIREMRARLEQVNEQISKVPEGEAGRQQRVMMAVGNGCILRALEELDQEAARMTNNLDVERPRILLLLEAGRVEDAHNAAEQFAESARRAGVADWSTLVALTNLPEADYKRAIEVWRDDVQQSSKVALNTVLATLPPRPAGTPWPLATTRATYELFYMTPETIAAREIELAQLYLEQGEVKFAEEQFREALKANPETPSRMLIAYYLGELTGKIVVEPFPPSETVPGLFAPEPVADMPDDDPPDGAEPGS
ncbi:MAG: hypothetical protein EXS05_07605 [Planctomycetaceae bacterium]|nr:hypothetical protein [Planctomycetaceae bacterium]